MSSSHEDVKSPRSLISPLRPAPAAALLSMARTTEESGVHGGAPKPKMGHISSLDGIRGMAVLMVFLFHYINPPEGDSWLAQGIEATIKSLWCGVDLFFVLSGFLITGILLDSRKSPFYFRNFFARRALRIFPLYFALLFAVLVILPWLFPSQAEADARLSNSQAWLWSYCANIKIALNGFTPFLGDRVWLHHLWSLAVEEHFYFAWPFVVYFVSPRTLWRICLVCAAGSLALRIGLLFTTALPLASYVATPCRLDGLVIGAMAALMVRDSAFAKWRPHLSFGAVASALGLAAVLFTHGRLDPEHPWMRTWGYTLLAIASSGLVLACVNTNRFAWIRKTFTLGGLRTLGKYSYGLYLYHIVLAPTLNKFMPTAMLQVQWNLPYFVAGLLRLAAAFAICFGVAYLSWHLYEKHWLKLKRRFDYQEHSTAAKPIRAAA